MEINIKDYYDLVEIGKGSFGTVYKARRKSDNKIIALKVITVPRYKKHLINTTEHEIKTLKMLSVPNCNPFVICYYESYYDEERKQFLVEMEYIEGRNMYEFIDSIRDDNPDEVVYYYLLLIAKDLAQGLQYIHRKNIIHNDIKPENIMIDQSFTPRIIDFGLSCIMNIYKESCKATGGTPWYFPPEYLQSNNRIPASDMWALGITLYRTATEKYPYIISKETTTELFKAIENSELIKLKTSNEQLNDVVNGLLIKDPSYRLTADDVLKKLAIIERPSYVK